jgi:hypothetical protein
VATTELGKLAQTLAWSRAGIAIGYDRHVMVFQVQGA